jgi:hypothetical protein
MDWKLASTEPSPPATRGSSKIGSLMSVCSVGEPIISRHVGWQRSAVETLSFVGVTQKPSTRKADSTDPIASFFTRRFGLAGGLAWLGAPSLDTTPFDVLFPLTSNSAS